MDQLGTKIKTTTTTTTTNKNNNNQDDGGGGGGLDENQLERIFRKRLCRLCRRGDSKACKFITPCKCLGPFSFVHQKCLENWLETTKQYKCEICRFDFRIVQHNRNIFDWLKTRHANENYEIFLEILTRFLNILFISAVGILLIDYCHSVDGGGDEQQQRIDSRSLRLLVTRILPIFRLGTCFVSLLYLIYKIWIDSRQWLAENKRIEVLPYDHRKDSKDIPKDHLLNSYVRVSGMKNMQKYIKKTNYITTVVADSNKQQQQQQQKKTTNLQSKKID